MRNGNKNFDKLINFLYNIYGKSNFPNQCNWHLLPSVGERRSIMTKREVLNAIVNGEINEEVKAWAGAQIEKMDAANEKRRNSVSKKAQENAPLVKRIVEELLGEEPLTATDIAAALEVSPQKASALARRAVAEGDAVAHDIKVKGKGTMKGYTRA